MTHRGSFLLEYFRKRSFRCGVGPYTLTLVQVFTFKSLSQIEYLTSKSFLSYAVICDWPVRIGRSFMGTIANAITGCAVAQAVLTATLHSYGSLA